MIIKVKENEKTFVITAGAVGNKVEKKVITVNDKPIQMLTFSVGYDYVDGKRKYIKIECWGQTAQIDPKPYDSAFVVGELKVNQFKNAQGEDMTVYSVRADYVDIKPHTKVEIEPTVVTPQPSDNLDGLPFDDNLDF